MVLALLVASCGADTTSPTPAATPPSSAEPTSTGDPASPAAEHCELLAEVQLADVTAISAELETSGSVAGEGGLPDFCRVALTVDPAINIELWLPTDQYNNRFQGVGGGGYAGQINFGGMAEALRAGYATASTDTGHVGHDLDGSFALTPDGTLDMPLIEDFASRSLAELTDKSRSLVAEFYGEEAEYAYWNGCSTGGRQGLMLAQRYPDAYDGILAGAPAINWDRFMPSLLWPQVVMDEELGQPIEPCKLAEATHAAVEACDAVDGVSDGLLDDPAACDFDPVSLVGVDTPCGEFSEADAAVIQAIWDGPRTSDGELLWYGLTPGAPLEGLAGMVPFPIGLDYVRLWIHQDPTFDWHTLGYVGFGDAYRTSQDLFHDVIGTDEPDLTPFRDAGGRLLMWHGWYDQFIPPEGSIDYYDRVLETVGDTSEVAEFARLFMAGGAFHCEESPELTAFDAFGALVDWVETDRAPETITASRGAKTRPLCPYPGVAAYDGTGDQDRASSFICTEQ
jgi:pimeloyl-ACP methyl ester carboxylesterase